MAEFCADPAKVKIKYKKFSKKAEKNYISRLNIIIRSGNAV